ncbi:hypothetical protein ACFL5E_04380, partial [Candidatus Omnitrophota bacterium]
AELKRASAAGSDDRMSRSITYRGELADPQGADTDNNGLIDAYEDKLASVTYYDYATRLKGEEVTDYTEKFNSDQEVTNTTVYLYEAGLNRASAAGADDRMSRSVTYRGELQFPQSVDGDNNGIIDIFEDKLASITYYDFATRLKGEEVTDYTEKYNSAQEVTNTTVYLYEADLKRASAAGSDDRMSRSVTYRDELADPQGADGDANGLIDDYEDKLASITYYDFETRLKGEEVTDYSENFNRNQVLTQTSVYLYEADLKRAEDAGAGDRMSRTVAYHESIDTEGADADTDGIIDSEEDQLASITYYDFESRLKGEEVVDVIERYGVNNIITGTTIYYYESDGKRADSAKEDDRISRTVSYRGQVDHDAATGTDGLLEGDEDQLTTITYYRFENRLKGEEVIDYNEAYNRNQKAMQTTRYYYGDYTTRPDDADNLMVGDRLVKTASFNRFDKLTSESIYGGEKGEEQVKYQYAYYYRADTDEVVPVSRTEFVYHDDNRTDRTLTYDIKNLPIDDTSLLIRETTYNYRSDHKHTIDTVVAVGTQYFEKDPSKVTGINTTVTQYNDYGQQESSVTTGRGYRHYGTPQEVVLSAYTTSSTYDDFGVSLSQETVGRSYTYLDLDDNGTPETRAVSGAYTTTVQIDEFGITLESMTVGMNGQDYDADTGKFDYLKGRYTTAVTNNEYGTLTDQVTTGKSFSMAWNGTNYVLYKTGTYTTRATSIDAFGIVQESTTVGESVKLIQKDDLSTEEILAGRYTTTAVNNEFGTLVSQTTVGESYNKIYNGTDYETLKVGGYTTTATVGDYGVVAGTQTVGRSTKLIENELSQVEEILTGVYTTMATNNEFGTLMEQVTVGESYNKIYNGTDYELLKVGGYTTTTTDIDAYGTVRETQTVGSSTKLIENEIEEVEEITTGAYTTTAVNNQYGTLTSQVTVGESYNKIYNGIDYELLKVGGYTTTATIDGFGMVRGTETVGSSTKLIENEDNTIEEIITGRYTTTAQNNVYGALESQLTVGESYNKIYNGIDYELLKVGGYTTTAAVDDFGTVRSTQTVGESTKLIENEDNTIEEIRTGRYTTTAQNNVYGTLVSQLTVGESYNKIYNGTDYELLKVGGYETTATVDDFGTVRATQTVGSSTKLVENEIGQVEEIKTGVYTTDAQNNVYGTLVS